MYYKKQRKRTIKYLNKLMFIPAEMRKKEKGFRKELVLPLFVILIMVMSMFGYMWGSSRARTTYNGFAFIQLENGLFRLRLGDILIDFNNYPSGIEWINASRGVGGMFSTPMVYVTYDSGSEYAETMAEMHYNIAELLDKVKGIYAQNAFTSETEHNIPVITCENATFAVPVISIEKANSTEIILEDNCIIVNAKNRQEMLMAYERLLYSIFGVME